MRSLSLLAVIIALVVAGLLVKRQLSAVRMAAPPPASRSTAPAPAPAAAATEQFRDALDHIMRERQSGLEQAGEAAR